MIFNIITLFREIFKSPLKYGIVSRAIKNNKIGKGELFKKIDKDVLKISGGNTQINFETELIEKPYLDE